MTRRQAHETIRSRVPKVAAEGENAVPAYDALKLAFDASDIGIWEADLATGELRVSERLGEMFGVAAGTALRRIEDLRDRVHPDDRARVKAAFETALDGRSDYRVEHRAVGDDGQVRWLASRGVVVLDAEGRPLRAIGTVIDISSRRHAEEVHGHLAAIVESSDDAIVGKSLDAVVTSWNRGAERLFGYTAAEMVGQPIARVVPPDRPDDVRDILATIARGEHVDHYETERMHKDGHRIHVSLSVSPIRDASGRIIGASKIARDVTGRKLADQERERLLAEARQARAEAEAANQAKDQLLSIVSHELRTPLASMMGWVRVLSQGKLTPERTARALQTIERSGRLQAEMIDDLLDVSRIVTGRLRLNLRRVDLGAVARAALDAIRPDAAAKEIRLEASVAAGVAVVGDTTRLEQIVSNLLNNALKFTPAGGCVELRLERSADEARLVVRDTGRGIAPEFLPQIFEPFRQADDVKRRKTGGLGLGLAIVRSLIEQHRGSVKAESAGQDAGATFTVTLPLSDAPAADAVDPGDAVRGNAPRLDGVRVLLVDDEIEACEALGALLMERGAEVAMVFSARAAREALDKWQPDVLMSDIRMPGEDGYALVKHLRATRRAIPAVAITAYHHERNGDRAAAAGFDAYLSKPVEPEGLVALLASLTARHPAN